MSNLCKISKKLSILAIFFHKKKEIGVVAGIYIIREAIFMARIPQEKIDEIRAAVNIVDIIKDYVDLTPHGKNYFGICPFHADHSPSMSVSFEKQLFKCFSCNMAGNVFKFVSEIENISYMEAVQKIGNKVGIFVEGQFQNTSTTEHQKEYDLMDLTSRYFENNLSTDKGVLAREYLDQRGLHEEMRSTFGIGLALENNSLYEFLKKKKFKENDLLELGLIRQNGLEYQDVCIIFPIHNADGRVIGFTGRVYEKDRSPKYLNSQETKIFKKGMILFNYHRARNEAKKAKKMILVEGNMDAIRMYASGFKNTVATMGTALTKEQIYLLQKLRIPILLMFDNDDAGAMATMNNGSLLEEAGVPIEVVRLSGEKDPDEYILKNGVEAMQDNLNHPLSFLEFKLQFLKQNKNLKDTENLVEYLQNVLKSLKQEDRLTIDITLNRLAKEYDIPYETLKKELDDVVVEKKEEIVPKVTEKKRKSSYKKSVEHILYYMMNDEKYIKMYQNRLGYFKEELYRGIANEILYYYEKHKHMVLADFLNYVEESPLKNEIYEVIGGIVDDVLDETIMEDYLLIIQEANYLDKIKKIKDQMKASNDVHEKEMLGLEQVEITQKLQEIRNGRSVKE